MPVANPGGRHAGADGADTGHAPEAPAKLFGKIPVPLPRATHARGFPDCTGTPERSPGGGHRAARGQGGPWKGAEEEIPSRLVVSSIGSIPEPIQGIPIRGEVYRVRDARTGELEGMEGIFAVGNAVTGKEHLGLPEARPDRLPAHAGELPEGLAAGMRRSWTARRPKRLAASAVAEFLAGRSFLSCERVARILERVRDLQGRAGYRGDYREYIAEVALPS